jgi:regulator of sirC expression with transglutaminase-like and TPR domain
MPSKPRKSSPRSNAPADTPVAPQAPTAVAPAEPIALAADLPFPPACSHPDAFALLHAQMLPVPASLTHAGRKRRLDGDDGLLAAAVAVAMHALPQTEVADTESEIAKIADAVSWHVKSGSDQAKLAYLHQILFDEYAFRGNGQDYYNPRNSYLPSVLKTRRGLPIMLAMVYKLVAGRLGLRSWGVGLPGHFVAGVDCHGPALVDCFHGGRLLDRDNALQLVHETAGEEAEFDESMLRPVTHRHWITRLIQNLLQIHSATGNYTDVAAMLEFELLLWPDQLHLQRDLGLVLARIGQPRPAATWIGKYLEQRPDDPQRGDLEELLSVLR